jgi:glycosyltransferase involved in cell wall biosynthesis
MKLKILQIVYAFYPPYNESGNSRVAYGISKALALKGHDVTVYTTNVLSRDKMFELKKQVYNIHNVRVHYCKNILYKPYLPIPLFFSKDLLSKIKESLMKYDIVHTHEYRFYISPLIYFYAKRFRIPYIVQAHGSLSRIGPKQSLKWLFDALFGYRLLRNAAKVIALSRVEAEQYKVMGVPEEKIAIIPNGIDLSEYAELPPKGFFKKKFSISEDKKIILYLGRIHKTKGIEFLIKAYAYLKNKMNFKDAVLVIAGPDDGYLSEVKSLVHNLGISSSVLFTGLLSEIDKIRAYVDSDVVVNVEPSNVYGLVPLEAAACSTPVIVSSTNAISEVVATGEFGYSVKYGDVISLASMLHRVLSNKELTEILGRNGRKYIFSNFGWNKIIEKYEQVYTNVINGKR